MTAKGRPTAIVLAAGHGKRMRSDLPKVMHRVAGRPLLAHVLAALEPLGLKTVVVTPPAPDRIRAAIEATGLGGEVEYVVQDTPGGTAHAVKVALEAIGETAGPVLVVSGDAPVLRTETLNRLLDAHGTAAVTMLTARVRDPGGYGRVVRGAGDAVEAIVEDRDASEQELTIDEVNAGMYVFDAARLSLALAKVDRENTQGEFYLTDVVGVLVAEGDTITALQADAEETAGVNTRSELAAAGELLRRRACEHWMDEGVTIVDPQTTYIDASVQIGRDALIHPFSFLEGDTTVGEGAEIGPQARIIDSSIGPGATVSYAVVRGSTLGPGASAGPFASLRPGTVLARGARVGTFVETKETTLGANSRAPHLSYLGDAEIGKDVNVGAGSITCNWDGTSKHKTEIDDEAYIGSDTMFVAPVRIGKKAATGAGAVVKGEVPDGALAVGMPARIIEGKGNRMSKKQTEPDTDGEEPRQ